MELSKQVVSLELARKLKELGVKQESDFYYTRGGLDFRPFPAEREVSAFTVAELGEMLPPGIFTTVGRSAKEKKRQFSCSFANFLQYRPEFKNRDWHTVRGAFRDENEADVRARMLIHLVVNKLVTL